MSTRPLKRTRLSTNYTADSQRHLSSSSSTSSSGLHRHPEIWYDDGNIVLIAGATAFRIYRGLLAGQSTVFSDMFSSSISSPDEMFDGCPVVHLSDSPHDLAHLLHVLLPKSHIHYHPTRTNRTHTFDEVSAIIRLAHKYNIQQVQDQALASLQECGFVSSFASYSNPPPKPYTLEPVQHIGVVNLARLTDTPSLLPLALFQCAYLGSAVLDGWTHEDGIVEHLSDADLRRCVDARIVLTDERTLSLSRLFDATPSHDCATPAACVEALRWAQDFVMRSELTREVNALGDWRERIVMLGKGSGAPCRSCKGELLTRNERERKRIFDSLPKVFGITAEGWGTVGAAGQGNRNGE